MKRKRSKKIAYPRVGLSSENMTWSTHSFARMIPNVSSVCVWGGGGGGSACECIFSITYACRP